MDYKDYQAYFSPAMYKYTDLIVSKGKGCYLYDQEGTRYMDFVQGIAVNALGHCHPRVVAAVQEQAANLMDASFNLVNYPKTLELAKRIAALAPGDLSSIFFSNGGAEATDGALKLAKCYTKRPAIIAFKGSFHGRTIGATTVTASNSKYRKYYEPLMGSVYFAPYPSRDICPKGFDEEQRSQFCLEELEGLFRYVVDPEMVAAILLEPVLGEGGYVVPPKSFLQGVRKLCDKYGILMIVDEIQAGYGRTGKMFACTNFDIIPDIVTLGKAIGGGLPMSAVLSTPTIMEAWTAGTHGSTFGGNPMSAAAGCAVLDEFEASGVIANCVEMGAYLKQELQKMQARYPFLYDVRGLGLMVAAEFSYEDGTPAPEIWAKVKKACFDRKLLTLNCGVYGNGMRFATPLNIKKEELDEGLEIFESALQTV